ncbi:hypothetical protein D9758_003524 [Tetrapyrgos nigripes]|uniref:Amidohydrolase-related domain-containing protein n=1 Tax=Tetrapyrgos nigripes TaxID=182062 RepID=A0A8H5GV42_9AGAR|nr:hypothetical protein D9758_003524 [Tetrapyrgos nigripes]
MKAFFKGFGLTSLFALSVVKGNSSSSIIHSILQNARADNIDLTVLPFLNDSLDSIVETYANANNTSKRQGNGTIIDTHAHVVPDWYRAIQPTTGGNPTPSWDLTNWLSFLDTEGIGRAIFSFSAPSANVFPTNKTLTIALARLMNEHLHAISLAVPNQLQFYAHVPLPYADEAIVEAKYAVEKLGAVGFFLTSNFEDNYLGNEALRPFLAALDGMEKRQIVYVHPTTPVMKDFPYAPSFTQAGSLAAIQGSDLLSGDDKTKLFTTNAEGLFGETSAGGGPRRR